MNADVLARDSLEVVLQGPDPSVLRLGLLVPLSGPLGLTGPSAVDAASLAASEINAVGGVGGRPIELVLSDAGGRPEVAARQARQLATGGLVDAFVGLHTSDVHRAIEASLDGRTPYIFTPPQEGGSRLPGVVLLGESPVQQLGPALAWLFAHRRLRRWALIGSDYIWAWSVHRVAASVVKSFGGQVLMEQFVPFGLDPEQWCENLLGDLVAQRVEALVLSLIGSDLAMFNRAFASSALSSHVVRVSGSLEENGLLAAGGDDSGELYAAMRSFAGQQDPRRVDLADRYRTAFGDRAPVLDAYSEGCYDGVHLAAALGNVGALNSQDATGTATHLLDSGDSALARRAWATSPLGPPRRGGYLARAEGLDLMVVAAR
jgi:ABC-type branched-subunit amino acid transport system substrate-binding protein